ncbi:MAG: imidazole glycerol phosphate synthase subunit HisH [Alphaproteobacteria bacterium]|nr:imidazole glycerol phosphate synthase subunit HisH [Alphaproteobacteria bacterium]
MIVIIDSGVANLASVEAAFSRMNVPVTITDNTDMIRSAKRLILPGVGSAPAAMRKLEAKGLTDTIRQLTQPVLGICLGMQLLFDASEEGADDGAVTPCLGVISGTVRKLKDGPDRPIPHMGWNEITLDAPDHPLLCGVASGAFMYFVHSFAVPPCAAMLASCTYSEPFTAMCGHKNFFGCQFHPERSGEAGQQILRNFIEMRA